MRSIEKIACLRSYQEKGIVLPTALIFLVLILLLLKFSLSSSVVQEKKASIDRDGFIAKQSANLALREAERYLTKYARDQLEKEEKILAGECLMTGTSPCEKRQELEISERMALIWNPDKRFEPKSLDVSNISGVYDGNEQNYCKENSGKAAPRWTCIDWSDADAVIQYGDVTQTTTTGMESLHALPRYYIERFTANQIEPSLTKKIVILRITAIGYGLQGSGMPSQSILQATYMIRPQ